MNSTIELLRSHRSIRKFTDRQVDREMLREIISAAQCASTSHNIQAYTVIHVTAEETKKAIARLAGPQPYVSQAPVFLVFCADLNRLETACRLHGREMDGGSAEQFVTATVDVALLAQNVMIGAESYGLGGVYIGGIRNDPRKVCELLEIPENVYPVFGMCLGWPAHDPPTKPRLPLDAVLANDRYPAEHDERQLRSYDEITNRYYLSRDENLRDERWTSQMAEWSGTATRLHMKPFLNEKGFFKK